MSTRCNIVIKEGRRKSYVYHHCDGYPSYMGMVLHQFLKNLYNWYQIEMMNDLIKRGVRYTCADGVDEVDNDFKWAPGLAGDVDYIYVIDCKKQTLTCYKRPSYDVNVDMDFEKTFEIVTIN